ncbi:MAG: rhodanese-like domain-containing protein [Phormidesmis sp.]
MTVDNPGEAFEAGKENASNVLEKAESAERDALNAVEKVKNVVGKATPVPTKFEASTSPSDLKKRLDWGEPALSILDVRDRESFNEERITGAMPMPVSDLIESAKTSFEPERDLFVYGDSDAATAEAASQLYAAGFKKVSAIEGGLEAWKAIGGPIEGQKSL